MGAGQSNICFCLFFVPKKEYAPEAWISFRGQWSGKTDDIVAINDNEI